MKFTFFSLPSLACDFHSPSGCDESIHIKFGESVENKNWALYHGVITFMTDVISLHAFIDIFSYYTTAELINVAINS
jgi:hypothetical protein